MLRAIVRGKHTDLSFDGAACHLQYTTDQFTQQPGIGGLLGSRRVPVEALAGVRFEPARGLIPARIRLLLRPGADPLLEVNQCGFHDVEHPYVLPLASSQQEPGRLLVARLEAAIARTEVAHLPASRFLVPPPALPPVSAKVHGGVVGFDGSLITVRTGRGWTRRQVIPITAVRMVQWTAEPDWRSGQLRLHLHDQTLDGDTWQRPPGSNHDPLVFASRDGGRAILLATAVAWVIGRADRATIPARTASTAAPVASGLAAAAPATRAVLEGVAGRAVLNSGAVTITARGVTRRIPLPAIDWVELVDVRYPPGEGYVRVHLEGAHSDLEPFDPWRDVDTVVHTDDHAALDFAHQVTTAIHGMVRVAHPELIATRGDRPDLARALGRASPRARTLTPALRILPLLLQPEEQIEVLEAADWKALLGLLAVTDRRVLLVAGEPVAELTWELPAAGTVATWTAQDDHQHGALSLLARSGTHLYVTGVWTPWRFTQALSQLHAPARPGTPTDQANPAGRHPAG